MTTYSTFNTINSDIKDPVLRGFIDNVTDIMKASVGQVLFNKSKGTPISHSKLKVGKKQVKEYASVGEVVDNWLQTKNSEQIKALEAQTGTRSFMSATPFVLSHLKHLKMNTPKYILTQVDIPKSFSYVNDNLMFKRFANIFNIAEELQLQPAAPAQAFSLKFNLRRVRCVDETNPEFWGSDEISAGGVTIDDKEVEAKINQFNVGNFNDGTIKNFNPAKVLKSFP